MPGFYKRRLGCSCLVVLGNQRNPSNGFLHLQNIFWRRSSIQQQKHLAPTIPGDKSIEWYSVGGFDGLKRLFIRRVVQCDGVFGVGKGRSSGRRAPKVQLVSCPGFWSDRYSPSGCWRKILFLPLSKGTSEIYSGKRSPAITNLKFTRDIFFCRRWPCS